MPCPVFVFDFDGVIVSEGGLRTRGVEALGEALEMGGRVYIVSGRRPSNRGYIGGILREAGFSVARLGGLYLRESGSEESFKLETYIRIRDLEGCIGEIHDDNPEALWPARRLVEHGLILHYDEYCEAIYGYSILRSCREA
ncbi:MAG: HAD family hydrolase [Desulfurococcales archaeon]|nr:HAD family hydrolase [Desulfurococcales archaeon]